MNLRVLFFSVLRDVTGRDEIALTCDGGETVADLLTMLYARWPQLEKWDGSLLIAMDQHYVKRDAVLHEGAEVAIMPPVQGG